MSNKIQTIGDIRKYVKRELKSLYPSVELYSITNIIVKTLLNTVWLHRFTDPGYKLSASEADKVCEIVLQLKTGKPVQYVLGETIFYNCRISVNSYVLIPRQETEELADIIIRENRNFSGRIADLGTGSGCIAIALAKNLPGAEIVALDNSREALDLASSNAAINEVKIEFVSTDILSLNLYEGSLFNIIASNPPYVRESEKILMHRNVLDFEPHAALFVPDEDPLVFYRKIFEASGALLLPGGKVYFEINEAMGSRLKEMAEEFDYREVKIINDLNGKERILKGEYNGR